MVEILKRGTKKTEACKLCGCVFTYEEEDVESYIEEGEYHGDGNYKYIRCPQCNNKIYLECTK